MSYVTILCISYYLVSVPALLVSGELKNIGKAEAAAQSGVAPSFKFLEEVQKHHKTPSQGNPYLGRDSKCAIFQ
jgi:hypothetical protein